jgi:hypothetical protein
MAPKSIERDEKKLNNFINSPVHGDSSVSIRTEQQSEWTPAEELKARAKYTQHTFDLFSKVLTRCKGRYDYTASSISWLVSFST